MVVRAAEFRRARADLVVPAGVVGRESLSFDVRAFVFRRGVDVALVDTLMFDQHAVLIDAALDRMREAGISLVS
jgi:hypothetical protein